MPPKRFPTLPSESDDSPKPINKSANTRFPMPMPSRQPLLSGSASANSTINSTRNPAISFNHSTFSEEKSDQLLNWIDKLKLQATETFEKQRLDTVHFRKAAQSERLRQKYRQSLESPSFDKLGNFLKENGQESAPDSSHKQAAMISPDAIASRALQYRDSPYPEENPEGADATRDAEEILRSFQNYEDISNFESPQLEAKDGPEQEGQTEEHYEDEDEEEGYEYEYDENAQNGNRKYGPAQNHDGDDDDVVEILSDESAVEEEEEDEPETRTYQQNHLYSYGNFAEESGEGESDDQEEAQDEGESIDLAESHGEDDDEDEEEDDYVSEESAYVTQPHAASNMFPAPRGRPRLSDHVTGFSQQSTSLYHNQHPSQESDPGIFDSEDLDEVSDNLDAVEEKYSDDLAEDEVEQQLDTGNYSETEKNSYYEQARSGKDEELSPYAVGVSHPHGFRTGFAEDEESDENEAEEINSVDSEDVDAQDYTQDSSSLSDGMDEVPPGEEQPNAIPNESANFFAQENYQFRHEEADLDAQISKPVQDASHIVSTASSFYDFPEEAVDEISEASEAAEEGDSQSQAEDFERADSDSDEADVPKTADFSQEETEDAEAQALKVSQMHTDSEENFGQESSQLYEDAESSIYEDSELPIFEITSSEVSQRHQPFEALAQAALVDAGREDAEISNAQVDEFLAKVEAGSSALLTGGSDIDIDRELDEAQGNNTTISEPAPISDESSNEASDGVDSDESMVDAPEYLQPTKNTPEESEKITDTHQTEHSEQTQQLSSRFPTFKTIGQEDPILVLKQLKKTEKRFDIKLDSVTQLTSEYGDVSDSGSSVPSSPESINDFYDVEQPESHEYNGNESTFQQGDAYEETEYFQDTLEIEDPVSLSSQAFEMKPEVPVLADVSGDEVESDESMEVSSNASSDSYVNDMDSSEGIVVVEPINEEAVLTVFDDYTEVEEVIALVPSAVEEPPQTPRDELTAGLVLDFESESEHGEALLLQPTEIIEPADATESVVVETFEETTEYVIPTSIEELESKRNTPAPTEVPEDSKGSSFRTNSQNEKASDDIAKNRVEEDVMPSDLDARESDKPSASFEKDETVGKSESLDLSSMEEISPEKSGVLSGDENVGTSKLNESMESQFVQDEASTVDEAEYEEETENDINLEDLESYEQVETGPENLDDDDISKKMSPPDEGRFQAAEISPHSTDTSLSRKRKFVEEKESSSPVKRLKSALSKLNPFNWGKQDTSNLQGTAAESSEGDEPQELTTNIVSMENASFEFEVPSHGGEVNISSSASPEDMDDGSISPISAENSSTKESPKEEMEDEQSPSGDENSIVAESEHSVELGPESPPSIMHKEAKNSVIGLSRSVSRENEKPSAETLDFSTAEKSLPVESFPSYVTDDLSEDSVESDSKSDFKPFTSRCVSPEAPSVNRPVMLSVPPLPTPASLMRIAERNRADQNSVPNEEMDISPDVDVGHISGSEDPLMDVDADSATDNFEDVRKYEDEELSETQDETNTSLENIVATQPQPSRSTKEIAEEFSPSHSSDQEIKDDTLLDKNHTFENENDQVGHSVEDALAEAPVIDSSVTTVPHVELDERAVSGETESNVPINTEIFKNESSFIQPQDEGMAVDEIGDILSTTAKNADPTHSSSEIASEVHVIPTENEIQMKDNGNEDDANFSQANILNEEEQQNKVIEKVERPDSIQSPTQDITEETTSGQTVPSMEKAPKSEIGASNASQSSESVCPSLKVIPPSTENFLQDQPEVDVKVEKTHESDMELEDNGFEISSGQDENSYNNAVGYSIEQDNGASAQSPAEESTRVTGCEIPSTPIASQKKLISLEKLFLSKAEEMVTRKSAVREADPHAAEEKVEHEKFEEMNSARNSADVKDSNTDAKFDLHESNLRVHVVADVGDVLSTEVDQTCHPVDELRTPFTTPKKKSSPRKKVPLLTPVRRSSRIRSKKSDLGEPSANAAQELKSEGDADKTASRAHVPDSFSVSKGVDGKIVNTFDESEGPLEQMESVVDKQKISELDVSQNEMEVVRSKEEPEGEERSVMESAKERTSGNGVHVHPAVVSQPSEHTTSEKNSLPDTSAEQDATPINSVPNLRSNGLTETRSGDDKILAFADDSSATGSSNVRDVKTENTPTTSSVEEKTIPHSKEYLDDSSVPRTPGRRTRSGSERPQLNLQASLRKNVEAPVKEIEEVASASNEPKDKGLSVQSDDDMVSAKAQEYQPEGEKSTNGPEASPTILPDSEPPKPTRKRGRPKRKSTEVRASPSKKESLTKTPVSERSDSPQKKVSPKKRGRPRKTLSEQNETFLPKSSPIPEVKDPISDAHNYLEVKAPDSNDHPAQRTRSKSPIKRSIQELSSEIDEEPFKKRRSLRNRKPTLRADAAEAEREQTMRGRTRKR